jgi:hypothetical protein
MSLIYLKPISILSSSNLDPSALVEYLQNDPSAGNDATSVTCASNLSTWNIQVSMQAPSQSITGDLKLRVNVETASITTSFEVWQNGSQIGSSFIPSTFGYQYFTIPQGSFDPSCANMSVYFYGGKDSSVMHEQSYLYALDFEVNIQNTTVAPSLPTNISPTDGYASNGQTVTFSATVNDAEPTSDTVSLVVEYSTDQTFATGVTTVTSSAVAPSGTATVTSNGIGTNGTYYWRAKAKDSGGLLSGYTATRSFKITNASDPVVKSRAPSSGTVVTSSSQSLSAIGIDTNGNDVKLEFQVSSNVNFTSPVTYSSLFQASNNTHTVTATGLTAGDNFWRVRAINSLGTTSIWSDTYELYRNSPVNGFVTLDGVLTATNLTGATVANLSDNPSSPDANYATPTSTGSAVVLRVSFPTPPRNLATGAGLQTFTINAKKTTGTTANPTATLKLYESGTLKTTGSANTVTSNANPGSVFTYNWDASSLATISGANVELQVDGSVAGTGTKTTVAIGAVRWDYAIVPPPQTLLFNTSPPASVTNISATSTKDSVTLNWTNPTDTYFSYIEIYRDNVLIKDNYKSTSFTDTGLSPSTSYAYKFICVDTANGKSSPNTYSIATQAQPSSTPVVSIISITKTKISDEVGMNQSVVTFTFDTNVTAWTVNVLGSSYNTGTVADSGGSVTAGTQITATIDWTELYQEGNNRVNIYGQNASGWTPYAG